MSDEHRIETDSRTWRAVTAWADKRMTSSRAAIESPGLGPVDTEYERGRLAAVRELLKLAEPKTNTLYSAGDHVE